MGQEVRLRANGIGLKVNRVGDAFKGKWGGSKVFHFYRWGVWYDT